jgi:hypothetical protein
LGDSIAQGIGYAFVGESVTGFSGQLLRRDNWADGYPDWMALRPTVPPRQDFVGSLDVHGHNRGVSGQHQHADARLKTLKPSICGAGRLGKPN